MKCDECSASMINGVFCHERGCPNRNAKYEYGEWVQYFQCFECGDDVRKGEACNCMETDEPETSFTMLTYGTMPTKEDFLCAFYTECGTSTYRVRNSPYFGDNPIQSADYTAEELFAEVNRCANLYNETADDATEYEQKQAEEAGLMASCILQTLRFEWV